MSPRADPDLLLRGGRVLDVATGAATLTDLAISGGLIVARQDVVDPVVVDAGGLTICFGLWDCHAHPGSLMYDPTGQSYFEGAAAWTTRAGANLVDAVRMGVTGVRALGEPDDIDLAWSRCFRDGQIPGPRLVGASRSIRTTGGHGTAFPRRHLRVAAEHVCDGPIEMTRAVRELVEHGAHWVKILLTGGLYSEHETADGGQFSDEELQAVMSTAKAKGVPVSAHCGSSEWAVRFVELGGRSVEHGYALDERAAAAMAAAGAWIVPTLGVTHDVELMERDGWPLHARERAIEIAPGHAEALRLCLAAGVRLAIGADLNPIGPRLHAELAMLERIGVGRLEIVRAATTGGRSLNGFGDATVPGPGSVADLVLLDASPLDGLATLASPRGVISFGRFVVRPHRG
jgi:imidazolonepropionase-like amidohydrolase